LAHICTCIIHITSGSGVAHTNIKESFSNNQNSVGTWH